MCITFIFDRCHCSSDVVTPVKYESDWNNLTCIFAKLNISLTDKLTKEALVTPPLACSRIIWIPHSYGWFVCRHFCHADFCFRKDAIKGISLQASGIDLHKKYHLHSKTNLKCYKKMHRTIQLIWTRYISPKDHFCFNYTHWSWYGMKRPVNQEWGWLTIFRYSIIFLVFQYTLTTYWISQS